MSSAFLIAALAWIAIMLVMAGEAVLSAHNESVLRARGAIEPSDDVYRVMRWAYPLSFLAMAVEGAIAGPASQNMLASGLAILGVAKALKMSAISALGWRWTFRVLVLPDVPLVASGPYRFLRHPNYVAVIGELIAMALIVFAPFTGVFSTVGFGLLMLRRIRVEERALSLVQNADRF